MCFCWALISIGSGYSLSFGKNAFDNTAVASKGTSRGELAEAVTNHGFTNVDLFEVATGVNHESVTDELGWDLTSPRPGLDRIFLAGLFLGGDFFEDSGVDVWSFFG